MDTLVCENQRCSKSFLRYPKDISPHNYCSRSCAVTINNHSFPKRKALFHSCLVCGKEINRLQTFCSLSCRVRSQKKYSRTALLDIIKTFAQHLGRAPVRRELGRVSFACIREFGSWNNAVIAAQLNPHRSCDQRMYKRVRTKASDGHSCDSISEAIIDNWLTQKRVPHERDRRYPGTHYKADWVIGDTFVEYFGLASDSSRYDVAIREKQKLAQQHSIRLIEVYPEDLYPRIKLTRKLGVLT